MYENLRSMFQHKLIDNQLFDEMMNKEKDEDEIDNH
jgi:hypothetical protein